MTVGQSWARIMEWRRGPTTYAEPAPDAGENSFVFRPGFVPIAENGCAESLFVDLRPGPFDGCVVPYRTGYSDLEDAGES